MKKKTKWIIVAVVTVLSFILLHEYGTAWRGYQTIGGEIFAFAIPLFVWFYDEFKKDFKAIMEQFKREMEELESEDIDNERDFV